jgi:AcrR family transcriptional regulator
VEPLFRFSRSGGILAAHVATTTVQIMSNNGVSGTMDELNASDRRARKDAQRNLERVLHAAHELFAERGAEVTMEEVARRAGVGVGTIYRRFPSKEHLFAAVSHSACADVRHCLQAAAEGERDPVSKLRALVLVHYHRCAEQAALLDPHPTINGHGCGTLEQEELYAALHGLLQQVIAEGQRVGALRQGDTAVLAALCLELLGPRAFQNLSRVIGTRPEEVAEQVVRFVLVGLGTT